MLLAERVGVGFACSVYWSDPRAFIPPVQVCRRLFPWTCVPSQTFAERTSSRMYGFSALLWLKQASCCCCPTYMSTCRRFLSFKERRQPHRAMRMPLARQLHEERGRREPAFVVQV